MEKVDIFPTWLCLDEKNNVNKNHDGMLIKNTSVITKFLGDLNRPKIQYVSQRNGWSELLNLLISVIVISICKQTLFIWIMALLILIQIIRLKTIYLMRFINSLFKLVLFSLMVGLPSILISSPGQMLTWVSKVILILCVVQLFRVRMTWQKIIIGLRQLMVPSSVVLMLDITIKYCHILGNHIQLMLQSIQLRSYGKLKHPFLFLGRFIGRLFVISQREAEVLYMAMRLKGYSGNSKCKKTYCTRKDIHLLMSDVFLITLFIVLGG